MAVVVVGMAVKAGSQYDARSTLRQRNVNVSAVHKLSDT